MKRCRFWCTAKDVENAGEIRLRLSGDADQGKLTITRGSLKNGSLQIRIEVPCKTSLRVELAAGEVKVKELAGDKDIHLYAGQISIASARPGPTGTSTSPWILAL